MNCTKMLKLSGFIGIVSICFAFLPLIAAETCTPIPTSKIPADIIPNIFNITYLSYQLTVEANLAEQSKTLYATEYYDLENAQGRVDTLCGGEEKQFLYFNETGETFTSYDYTCLSKMIKDKPNVPHDGYGVYGWSRAEHDKHPIFGPSNLLRDAFVASEFGFVGKEPAQVAVRGIQTNVWRECANNNQLTLRYFFIDSVTENGFGVKGKPVPARVTVEGIDLSGKSISHTYDFVNYQVFVKDIDSVFNIPVTKGCKRLVPDLKKVPDYDRKDFHIEAELVYTPSDGSDTHSYVSNLAVTIDHKSQHLAYLMTPWKAHEDAKFSEPGDFMELIYDINNAIVYNLDKGTNKCTIKAMETNPLITFPDKNSINLLNDDIFITDNETIQSFHYLGEGKERGLPVSIFEKSVENLDDETQTIITRYHLSDNTFLDSEIREQHSPVKIDYWSIGEKNQFKGNVVLNLYAFSSKFSNKASKFDVTSCFLNDDQSKWIQMTFPVRDNDPKDIIPYIPYIQDNFLDMLLVAPVQISPLRFPKVIVDVDSDNIYITALLLERADFMLDFADNGNIEIPTASASFVGVTTKDGCAKACLEEPDCKFFSYCGAICKTSKTDPLTNAKPTENKECQLFQHMKIETSLPTMDEISRQIGTSTEFGSFQIEIFNTRLGKDMTFMASGFKDGIAFGLEGLTNKPEDGIENRFITYKAGSKYHDLPSDKVTPLGVQSYAACKRACVNNPNCESMSFCLATSECAISSLHGEEIDEKYYEHNSQCIILSRTYEDYFNRYPGLVISNVARKVVDVASAEACAKACVQDKSLNCLSFDFCPYTGVDGLKPECLLHETHFLNDKEDKKVNNKEGCGHYSKKLVYDFDTKRGQELTGNFDTIVGAVTAEQCSKMCQENTAIVCNAFDICRPSMNASICRMTSRIIGTGDRSDKPTCNVYERKAKVNASPVAQPQEGYSKSTVGGVTFFLFLIGAAIGVGAMYAFGYYRANRRS